MPNTVDVTLTVVAGKINKAGTGPNGNIDISPKGRITFTYEGGAFAVLITGYTPKGGRKSGNYNGETPAEFRVYSSSGGSLTLHIKEENKGVEKGERYDYALALVMPGGGLTTADPQIIIV